MVLLLFLWRRVLHPAIHAFLLFTISLFVLVSVLVHLSLLDEVVVPSTNSACISPGYNATNAANDLLQTSTTFINHMQSGQELIYSYDKESHCLETQSSRQIGHQGHQLQQFNNLSVEQQLDKVLTAENNFTFQLRSHLDMQNVFILRHQESTNKLKTSLENGELETLFIETAAPSHTYIARHYLDSIASDLLSYSKLLIDSGIKVMATLETCLDEIGSLGTLVVAHDAYCLDDTTDNLLRLRHGKPFTDECLVLSQTLVELQHKNMMSAIVGARLLRHLGDIVEVEESVARLAILLDSCLVEESNLVTNKL